jgi:hypothetical protein
MGMGGEARAGLSHSRWCKLSSAARGKHFIDGFADMLDADGGEQAIEAMYILWRTTGDDIWRRRGWEMFEAVEKWTRTDSGYAGLVSVLATENPRRIDTGMARYVLLSSSILNSCPNCPDFVFLASSSQKPSNTLICFAWTKTLCHSIASSSILRRTHCLCSLGPRRR